MRRWLVLAAVWGCGSSAVSPPVQATRPSDPPPAPAKQRQVVTDTQIEVLDDIAFLAGSPTLTPQSIPQIEALARTLVGNPSIELIAVHAFGADAPANLQAELGAARARTIIDHLVARGVDRRRLVPAGAATPKPGASLRPEFEILKRSP